MDALVKNKCEFQLLKLISEVAALLDLDIKIESEAIKEGGVREIFKFLNKKKNKPYLLTSIYFLGILSSILINVGSDLLTKDSEQEELNREETRLRIKKLNQDLNEHPQSSSKDTVRQLLLLIDGDHKVRVFKSRFYATLLTEQQVYQFSAMEKSDRNIDFKELFITREEFPKQILTDENTGVQIIENANIEIVAPVLKASDMKWKAIYDGKYITFDLKDSDFKNAVLNKQYSFSNGTSIRCKLTFKQGLNELGDLQNKEFTVYNVIEVFDGIQTTPTSKQKQLKEIGNQTKLKLE